MQQPVSTPTSALALAAPAARSAWRPFALAGIGLGPVLGGVGCWALCAWQAVQAKRHPGVAPNVVSVDGLHGPDGHDRIRVTWLGDSLAAGIGADHVDDTPAVLVARMLQRPVDLRILAVPGARSADVVEHQLPALDDADLVVVCVGSNDVASRTPRRDFVRSLDQILDATAPRPTVVLSLPDISMADRIGQPLRWLAGLRARHFEKARARATDRNPHAVSVDIATRPHGLARKAGRDLLCADRFHPGPQVYRIWADRIVEQAQVLLAAWADGPAPAVLAP
jgi:lysophospholipase L1-like esterase